MTDSPAGDSPLLRLSIAVTVAATARRTPASEAPDSASASATVLSEAASDGPGGSCVAPTGAQASLRWASPVAWYQPGDPGRSSERDADASRSSSASELPSVARSRVESSIPAWDTSATANA
jgi:hypothetical protein